MKQTADGRRKVAGGYVEKVWLGDRWAWRAYDEFLKRLPFTAKTLKDCLAKLKQFEGDFLR